MKLPELIGRPVAVTPTTTLPLHAVYVESAGRTAFFPPGGRWPFWTDGGGKLTDDEVLALAGPAFLSRLKGEVLRP